MRPQELRDALELLGLTRVAFADRLTALSGNSISASYISDMCSDRKGSRDPSAVVRVAVRLMLENAEAQKLKRAVERAGFRSAKHGR